MAYVIGKDTQRVDALEKVTGAAMYSGDYHPEHMAYGKLLGSPHAHARIKRIDTTLAQQVPGVLGILTGKDVPELRTGGYVRDRHILCKEFVRYVGDYVALVVATTEAAANVAVKKIQVEYEVLPHIFSEEEAFSKNPPVKVHENVMDYVPTGFQGIEEMGLDPDYPNQFVSFFQPVGDMEQGFAESDVIVENTYKLPFVSHCTLETHQCVVIPEANGDLTVYASEQTGTTAKYDLARDLGMDSSKIHMHIPYLGGGFGGKTGISLTAVAAVAARKLGVPVRIAQTREENFVSGGLRNAATIWIKDGYKKDGTLHARHIRALCNGGAYSTHSLIMILCAGEGAVGNYRVPNFLMENRGVYTNTPPGAPYRALGSEYLVFAIERNTDIAADLLGMDRGQLRLKNLLVDGDTDCDGREVYNNGSVACMESVIDAIHLDTRRAPEGPWVYGKSVAIGNKFVGVEDPNGTAAFCKIEDDGTATLFVSHVELGQGGLTVDAMAAAETLGLPGDKIHVVFGNSDVCPHDQGTFCSRGTFVNGNAAIMAAEDAKRQMFQIASGILELPPEALDTRDGMIFEKANPEHAIPFSALFYENGSVPEGGFLLGRATWRHPDAFAAFDSGVPVTYSIGAWGVEVAVNRETGEIRLVDLQGCYDPGRVINPKACQGQIEGAFSMGLGQAIYEECLFNDSCKNINPNFRDYRIPTFMDGPRNDQLHFTFLDHPHRYGPHGAKGIGEVAMIPIMPAIANAVRDAIGAELFRLPFSRERVLEAIRAAENK